MESLEVSATPGAVSSVANEAFKSSEGPFGKIAKEAVMNRFWKMGVVGLLGVWSIGCVSLDEHESLQPLNAIIEEEQIRVKNYLIEPEALLANKGTQITSLTNELATKDRLVTSLNDERDRLLAELRQAQKTLADAVGKGPGQTIIMNSALPAPLNEKLKALAQKYPDLMEFDETKGVLRWKSDLLFDLDSDVVSASENVQAALDEFAKIVRGPEASGFDVLVVGHTCTTPISKPSTLKEHKTNWHLSAHRSISVMSMLANKQVPQTRIGVMGYGEHRPIAENSSQSGKAKNRRVEIYLVPRETVQAVGSVFQIGDTMIAMAR